MNGDGCGLLWAPSDFPSQMSKLRLTSFVAQLHHTYIIILSTYTNTPKKDAWAHRHAHSQSPLLHPQKLASDPFVLQTISINATDCGAVIKLGHISGSGWTPFHQTNSALCCSTLLCEGGRVVGLLSLVILLTLMDLCGLEASCKLKHSPLGTPLYEPQHLVVFQKGALLQKP